MISDIDTHERVFRPTFVIDTDEPYQEEEFHELRIHNVMFRHVGPCQRCKTTSLCPKNNKRNELMEPYQTIVDTRKHKTLGPIFGVYW